MRSEDFLWKVGHSERECMRALRGLMRGSFGDHEEEHFLDLLGECFVLDEGGEAELAGLAREFLLEDFLEEAERLEVALADYDLPSIGVHTACLKADFSLTAGKALDLLAEYRAGLLPDPVPMPFVAWLIATGNRQKVDREKDALTTWVKRAELSLLAGKEPEEEMPQGFGKIYGAYIQACGDAGVKHEGAISALVSMGAMRCFWAF